MPFYRTFPRRVPETFPSTLLVERMLRHQLPVEKLADGVFPLRAFSNVEHNRRGAYQVIEIVLQKAAYHTQESELIVGEQGMFTQEMMKNLEHMLALDTDSYQSAEPNLLRDLYAEMVDYHAKNKKRRYGRGILEVSGSDMKLTHIRSGISRTSRRKRIPFYRYLR